MTRLVVILPHKRVIKETLAIGLLKPSMNAMQSSA